jgi:hypothetical protein
MGAPASPLRLNSVAATIGIVVDDAPDEQSAIKKAIEEFKVSPSQRGRLIARRRD